MRPVPAAFDEPGGGLSLVILLPLTFSWAIVRYRLMDVDLIFKRGVTYTLATASLVGLVFWRRGGYVCCTFVQTRLPGLQASGVCWRRLSLRG